MRQMIPRWQVLFGGRFDIGNTTVIDAFLGLSVAPKIHSSKQLLNIILIAISNGFFHLLLGM